VILAVPITIHEISTFIEDFPFYVRRFHATGSV